MTAAPQLQLDSERDWLFVGSTEHRRVGDESAPRRNSWSRQYRFELGSAPAENL